jgi:DNA-binding NarL/FixJ family response regulator
VASKRLLICDHDTLELAALSRTATDLGFDVVDTAANGVELLRLAALHRPEAAVVRNELPGLSGIEATEDLSHFEPRIEVVLLTSDPSIESRGIAAGAFAVVPSGDLAAIETALGAVGEWLEGGERRTGTDRRSGDDRRQHQDWSKVTSERRSGEDRRTTSRRKADRERGTPYGS